jgi:sugar phosphate isomerase/epimerase
MSAKIGRRRFLKASAVLPVSAAGYFETTRASAQSPIQRAGTPRLKLSLNAWSFDPPLTAYIKGQEGGMSLFDLLEFCAEQGFDAIDPTAYFFPGYPDVPDRKFINEFKRRAFQLGLDISGTGIRNDFATADKATRAAGVELAGKWVQAAADMGAPVLRVFAGPRPAGHPWDEAAAWMADELKRCVEYGEKHGVIIGLQNHGDMLSSAEEMLAIVKRVQSDWFGLIIDTGWFTGPDPYADIERVIPYAVNWQVKEFLNGQKGPKTDLKRVAQLIRAANYRGYVPIETLNSPGKKDSHLRVVPFLNEWRKAIAETS